jgi:hypothetical protein
VAAVGVPRHGGELVDAAVVAEDVVAGQADLREVGDALLVARGGVDRLAGLLGQAIWDVLTIGPDEVASDRLA